MTTRAFEQPALHTIRILLVSDDEYLRLGVRALLERLPTLRVVDEATSVAQALRLVATLQPDVVLLESSGFEQQGLAACSAIAARVPGTRILLWSATTLPTSQVRHAGALGSVSRRAAPRELVQAIQVVALGQPIPAVLPDAAPGEASTTTSPFERLSRQERRLLTLVAEGMINRDIAQTLGLSEKTIKNYLTSIYIKLGISRRTEAVRLVTQLYHTGQAIPDTIERGEVDHASVSHFPSRIAGTSAAGNGHGGPGWALTARARS